MMGRIFEDLDYCIFDPTGNITALVETEVDIKDQPAAAARIMELEPDVEQVGFISYAGNTADGGVPVSLRMAGGEFCGNAAMCAAALFAIRSGLQGGAVPVRISGASAPVMVRLERQAADSFGAAAEIPPAIRIGTVEAAASAAEKEAAEKGQNEEVRAGGTGAAEAPGAGQCGVNATSGAGQCGATVTPGAGKCGAAEAPGAALTLPTVEMEGISHIIIEPDSGFFGIKEDSALAESLLRQWCVALGADCLGMMFLGEAVSLPECETPMEDRTDNGRAISAERGKGDSNRSAIAESRVLTPLVYVPGADTMFWENSCASGSAAAGMYLAARTGASVDVTFDEPAGRLRVESDPASGRTVLHGSAILRKTVSGRSQRPPEPAIH